jgi:hypothetical protein
MSLHQFNRFLTDLIEAVSATKWEGFVAPWQFPNQTRLDLFRAAMQRREKFIYTPDDGRVRAASGSSVPLEVFFKLLNFDADEVPMADSNLLRYLAEAFPQYRSCGRLWEPRLTDRPLVVSQSFAFPEEKEWLQAVLDLAEDDAFWIDDRTSSIIYASDLLTGADFTAWKGYLSDFDFVNLKLLQCNFDNKSFHKCRFFSCLFDHSRAWNTGWYECTLAQCTVRATSFSGGFFQRCHFRGTDFADDTLFHRASAWHCNFSLLTLAESWALLSTPRSFGGCEACSADNAGEQLLAFLRQNPDL